VLRKIPPHLGSVVEVEPDEAEVGVSQRRSVDESKMRLRFGQLKGGGSFVDRVHGATCGIRYWPDFKRKKRTLTECSTDRAPLGLQRNRVLSP
jgi:hypothetical protein